MGLGQTALLGAIAGLTIFLGLPLGRMRSVSLVVRGFLSALSAGILLFIFWDVMSAAHEILNAALAAARVDHSWGRFAGDLLLVFVGLGIGAFGLALLERVLLRNRSVVPVAGGSAEAAADPAIAAAVALQARRSALTLGMLIALAIGLHNFSEGLAIGVSARSGAVSLATVLIVGFALHNATEGFGIVGPLGGVQPSWRWLIAAGVIGGGPTFLGTIIGYHVTSAPLELSFYALAGGAILYVVGQLWGQAQRRISQQLVLAGIVGGFALGLASDLVITYAGG
jgi:zinc transporter, ZIP family